MDGDVVCTRTFPPPLPDIQDPEAVASKEKVVVLFAADNKYAIPLAVSMRSLLDHFPSDRELEIIVGDVNLSQENKDKLAAIYPVRFLPLDISQIEKIKINIVYHTSAIFARLLMPELLPEIEKALYLDCDIIVNADITRLWDMDITGHVLGAVQDDSIPFRDDWIYFNSGVLLMNLKKWRDEKVSEKAVEFVSRNITNFTDQDALNDIMRGNFLRVSKRWNANPGWGTGEGLSIIHFLGGEKPWWFGSTMKSVPKYFAIVDATPFKGWRPSLNQKDIVIVK
jgi:lipopolysaccharide biosynthesis glycosyltransferase